MLGIYLFSGAVSMLLHNIVICDMTCAEIKTKFIINRPHQFRSEIPACQRFDIGDSPKITEIEPKILHLCGLLSRRSCWITVEDGRFENVKAEGRCRRWSFDQPGFLRCWNLHNVSERLQKNWNSRHCENYPRNFSTQKLHTAGANAENHESFHQRTTSRKIQNITRFPPTQRRLCQASHRRNQSKITRIHSRLPFLYIQQSRLVVRSY